MNQFGGVAIDTVETNTTLYRACMNASGWSLSQASSSGGSGNNWSKPGWTPPTGIGEYSSNGSAYESRRKAILEAEQRLMSARQRLAYICYDTTLYSRLFQKSACKSSEITALQIADATTASAEEVRALRAYFEELNTITDIVAAADRSAGLTREALGAENARDAVVTPGRRLIDGSITWGAYSQARIDLLRKATIR